MPSMVLRRFWSEQVGRRNQVDMLDIMLEMLQCTRWFTATELLQSPIRISPFFSSKHAINPVVFL